MKRFVSLILAAVFPLSLFSWFVPTPYNQLDFILLWLVAMLVLALPLVYAEIGLANRSGMSPMIGMQKLTRDSDASTTWRSFTWAGLLLSMLVALSLVNTSASILYPVMTDSLGIDIQDFVLPFILIIAVTIASVWGIKTAIAGLALLLISFVLKISADSSMAFTMTAISLQEWARAVVLALVSVGAGSGIYWFANNLDNNTADATNTNSTTSSNKKLATTASSSVLPIWSVQVVAGVVAFVLLAVADSSSVAANVTGAICLLCPSAVLVHFSSQLISEKFARGKIGMAKALLSTLMLGLLLTVIFTVLPKHIMQATVVVTSLFSALVLSLFAGWQMKISHLRKSMNFGSEATYNIWRVAIRLLVPLSVLVGFVGWIQIWLGAS